MKRVPTKNFLKRSSSGRFASSTRGINLGAAMRYAFSWPRSATLVLVKISSVEAMASATLAWTRSMFSMAEPLVRSSGSRNRRASCRRSGARLSPCKSASSDLSWGQSSRLRFENSDYQLMRQCHCGFYSISSSSWPFGRKISKRYIHATKCES